MSTFAQTPSRDQRSHANNRYGDSACKTENIYHVQYGVVDKKPKSLISFGSSTGHRGETFQLVDKFYDVDEAYKRFKYPTVKGAHRFDGMASDHSQYLIQRGDPREQYMGTGMTTFEVVDSQIKFQYARELSKGTAACKLEKYPSRSQRQKVGYFKEGETLSSTLPGLFVSYAAVDKNEDRVPKFSPPRQSRPQSATRTTPLASCSTSRPQSAGIHRAKTNTMEPAAPNPSAFSFHTDFAAASLPLALQQSQTRPLSAQSRPLSAQVQRSATGTTKEANGLLDASVTLSSTAVSNNFAKTTTLTAAKRKEAPPSFIEVGDPIKAFNSSHRQLGRNAIFGRAPKFSSAGLR